MSGPTYVATGAAPTVDPLSGNTVWQVPAPAGVQEGDLLLLAVSTSPTSVSGGGTWTELVAGSGVWWRFAGDSEPASYTITYGSGTSPVQGGVAAWRGVHPDDPFADLASDTGAGAVPDVVLPRAGVLLTIATRPFIPDAGQQSVSGATSVTWSSRMSRQTVVGGSRAAARIYEALYPTAGATSGLGTWNGSVTRRITVGLASANTPPHAPVVTNPTAGQTFARGEPNTVAADFLDPDPGDSPSRMIGQVRLDGQSEPYYTWDVESPNTTHVIPANELVLGDHELRVKFADAAGEPGEFCDWVPFGVADRPGPPTIVDPINGATISLQEHLATISAAELEASRWQIIGDADGTPDPETVYYDATVESTTVRTRLLPFPDNLVWKWLRVWRKLDGLWSADAAEHRLWTSWVAPAVPTVTVDVHHEEVDGRMMPVGFAVSASHPTPDGDEPAVTHMHVWRRTADDSPSIDPQSPKGEGIRLQRGFALAPSATFIDPSFAVGVHYEYRVEAVGANGVSSFSAWTG